MVTILPAEKGYGDIGRNFGNGFWEGYNNENDQRALQKSIGALGENPSARQILDAVTNTKTSSPKAKQQIFENYLGVEKLEAAKQEAQQSFEAKQAENQRKEAEKQAKDIAEKNDAKAVLKASGKYSEKEINQLVDEQGLSSVSARGLSKPPEVEPFEKESDKLGAKRVDKYITEVEEAAKSASGDIVALNLLDSLGEAGGTGFKLENALADYLESKGFKNVEALRNPLSKAYNSVSKILMGGFGDIVKGKVSNFEFMTFKGMLAQAEDRPEAAKAMIEAQRLIRNLDIKENELMQEIRKEYESKGKSPPTDIAYEVEKRLRPIADAMTRETTARIKNILTPRDQIKNQKLADEIWERTMGGK